MFAWLLLLVGCGGLTPTIPADSTDTDVDDAQTALFISSVNGSTLNVGQELTLNGALLTLNPAA